MTKTAFETFHDIRLKAQSATAAWNKQAECLDVTVTDAQAVVLAKLAESQAKGLSPTQRSLVDLTGIDRSTISNVILRLVNRKLITRKRVKEDARAYAVALTKEGAEVAAKLEKIAKGVIEDLDA